MEFGSVGFWEWGKPENLEKNLWKQRRAPTNKFDPYDNAESENRTPVHIGGRRVLSPLHYPCSHKFCVYFLLDFRQEVGRCVIDGSVISEEQVGKRILLGVTVIVVKTNLIQIEIFAILHLVNLLNNIFVG